MAVYKRNNIWYIDYYIKVNGKRKRRREPVSPRRDIAEARLKEYREMIKIGKDPKVIVSGTEKIQEHVFKSFDGIIPIFNQFVPVFLKLHGKEKSKKMQESYRSSLGHLLPLFGRIRLNNITKVMVKTDNG